jgi:alpha-L-rhamnosidase
MYELYINGKRIGDQVLAPNPTDYRKSFFYNTHDVTEQIKNGKNAIATVLGNGRFFTMRQNYKTQKHNTFGYPKLLLQLEIEYADGTKKIIVSDETWKLNVDGPIRTNNEYDGEEYDATKEFPGWNNIDFNDSKWIRPEVVTAPVGKITAQMSEPMKVMQIIKPVSIKNLNNGKYILDMGQNFAGWLQIKVQGKRGQKVQLRFAESLKADGEIFTANLRDAKVTDIYTLKGDGLETWQPSFVYHGFRYVEIAGFREAATINDFEGKLIYDALETTGSFVTSNSVINSIYKNAWWGIASNYKGMPIDCPQRNERQPWLGDRVIGAMGESYLFDNAKLYAKWMDDIQQSQTEEGSIPDVAPAFWNYYSDDVTWPAAFITISNNLYNQFGDIRPIQKNYASMKKWMQYMQSKYMKDHIVTRDKYGDWCVPPEDLKLIHAKDSSRLTDGKLIATAYYFKLLSYMQRFAKLTGNDADGKEYELLAEKIKAAFHTKFYNPSQYSYSNNTITANLLPLYFGICPDSLKKKVFANIYKKIRVESKDHISTGLIGTQYLMRGLSEYDNTNLAFKLASNTTYPSYGYMAANGATTIWELWNGNTADPGMNSQNHVMMLGDLLIWYYENLAGIRTDKTNVGFKKTIMKPSLPDDLHFVNASYKSMHGLIKSDWKKNDKAFQWIISIPANTSATVYIPARSIADVMESGKELSKAEGVQLIKWENGLAIVQIGSGQYKFISQIK